VETNNKEKIRETLKKEGDWMSIVQVAKATGLSRTTTSKFLWLLAAEGRADHRKFAQAEAFRVKGMRG